MSISRRIAIAAAAALAGTAVALREVPGLVRSMHARRTPYDDLLVVIEDREAAEAIGRYALRAAPNFDRRRTAELLRARLRDSSLKQLLGSEVAAGKTVEVAGWVFPDSLALICALAAIT